MTAAFDALQPMSFGGYRFPVENYSIRGGIRDHVHEYPHSPGGAPEKLGRKLYEVRFTALFFESKALPPSARSFYGGELFTRQLNALRALWESQKTDTLVLPHIGSVQAYALEWDEKADARNRSGVKVDVTLREDQDQALLATSVDIGATTFPQRVDTLAQVRAQLYANKNEPSIFAQINSVANSILAIKDQTELYGSLVLSKVASLSNLLARADASVKDLSHPDNTSLLEAVHALWDSTNKLAKDIQGKNVDLKTYVVPLLMSIGDVSSAIYKTPSKGTDLMALNPLSDPLKIPAGTRIRYYPAAA